MEWNVNLIMGRQHFQVPNIEGMIIHSLYKLALGRKFAAVLQNIWDQLIEWLRMCLATDYRASSIYTQHLNANSDLTDVNHLVPETNSSRSHLSGGRTGWPHHRTEPYRLRQALAHRRPIVLVANTDYSTSNRARWRFVQGRRRQGSQRQRHCARSLARLISLKNDRLMTCRLLICSRVDKKWLGTVKLALFFLLGTCTLLHVWL